MSALNFEKDVLQKSYEKPVVVDFWAPWCGPCRVLGPVIEQIAAEQKDRWELVKLNTEEHPAIAQQYRVMSIPNVKMFYKGEVVDEFMGAYPRQAILKWLDENLPDERSGSLDEILQQLEASGNGQALAQLEQFVAANPDVTAARLALARYLVFSEPERAQALVQDITMDDQAFEAASDIQQLAAFILFSPDDSPVGQAVRAAQEALLDGHIEAVLQHIIQAVTLDKSYGDDLPRKTAIAFFRTLGPQHELTKKYRWRFDMALY